MKKREKTNLDVRGLCKTLQIIAKKRKKKENNDTKMGLIGCQGVNFTHQSHVLF